MPYGLSRRTDCRVLVIYFPIIHVIKLKAYRQGPMRTDKPRASWGLVRRTRPYEIDEEARLEHRRSSDPFLDSGTVERTSSRRASG